MWGTQNVNNLKNKREIIENRKVDFVEMRKRPGKGGRRNSKGESEVKMSKLWHIHVPISQDKCNLEIQTYIKK